MKRSPKLSSESTRAARFDTGSRTKTLDSDCILQDGGARQTGKIALQGRQLSDRLCRTETKAEFYRREALIEQETSPNISRRRRRRIGDTACTSTALEQEEAERAKLKFGGRHPTNRRKICHRQHARVSLLHSPSESVGASNKARKCHVKALQGGHSSLRIKASYCRRAGFDALSDRRRVEVNTRGPQLRRCSSRTKKKIPCFFFAIAERSTLEGLHETLWLGCVFLLKRKDVAEHLSNKSGLHEKKRNIHNRRSDDLQCSSFPSETIWSDRTGDTTH